METLRTMATWHMGLGFGLGHAGTTGETSDLMLLGIAVGKPAGCVCALVVCPVLWWLAAAFLAFLAAAASAHFFLISHYFLLLPIPFPLFLQSPLLTVLSPLLMQSLSCLCCSHHLLLSFFLLCCQLPCMFLALLSLLLPNWLLPYQLHCSYPILLCQLNQVLFWHHMPCKTSPLLFIMFVLLCIQLLM